MLEARFPSTFLLLHDGGKLYRAQLLQPQQPGGSPGAPGRVGAAAAVALPPRHGVVSLPPLGAGVWPGGRATRVALPAFLRSVAGQLLGAPG